MPRSIHHPVRSRFPAILVLAAWTGTAQLAGQSPSPVTTRAAAERYVAAAVAVLPQGARTNAEVWWEAPDSAVRLRPGSNGWVCRISFPRDRVGVNCHDARLAGYLKRKTALLNGGLNGVDARARIDEEVKAGSLEIPAGALEIAGSGPRAQVPPAAVVIRGNHFLYFPFATATSSGLPDRDPGDGRPWLHYAGQAEAHLMWPASSTR